MWVEAGTGETLTLVCQSYQEDVNEAGDKPVVLAVVVEKGFPLQRHLPAADLNGLSFLCRSLDGTCCRRR